MLASVDALANAIVPLLTEAPEVSVSAPILPESPIVTVPPAALSRVSMPSLPERAKVPALVVGFVPAALIVRDLAEAEAVESTVSVRPAAVEASAMVMAPRLAAA